MAKASKEKKGQKSVVHVVLMFFAALLTFGGPTYLLYVLQKLGVPILLLLLLGLTSFTAGVILFAYLLKGERKVGVST